MTTLLAKYSSPVLISLLLALFVLAWFFPSASLPLGIAIGLLTGLGVGFLLSQTWGRLVRASAK